MSLKQRLYDHLVTNNENIKAEYEGNNIQYPEQHRRHRMKSWIWLLGLNIKYKVLKISPNSPNRSRNNPNKASNKSTSISNAFLGSESRRIPSWKEVHLVKRFLEYDYCFFQVWDVLLYCSVDTQNAFYNLVGLKLGISFFSAIRSRAEETIALRKESAMKGRTDLSSIYAIVEQYTGIKAEKGIEAELSVLSDVTTVNPFMKDFLQMLSYNRKGLLAIADSVYSSEQIKGLLFEKGYSCFEKVIVRSENTLILNSVDFFSSMISEYRTDKIIYMGQKENTDRARMAGISVWEYFSPNELGNPYRAKRLPYFSGALYRSVVNQHIYCGHFKHSEKRELGYIYFGVLAFGFAEWIKEVCKAEGVKTVLLIGGLGDFFLPLLRGIKDIQIDSVLLSEEFAVRCLISEDAFAFFEFYVDRRCKEGRTVSYYLDIMDIFELRELLAGYGISTTDILIRNNAVYYAFQRFVLENKTIIYESYKNDFEAAHTYFSSFRAFTSKVALVSLSDRGYRSRAFKKFFEKEFRFFGETIMLTAVQTIGSHDTMYQRGQLKSYLFSEQNDYYGMKWPAEDINRRFLESVFSDCKPEFRLFRKCRNDYVFEFYDAAPDQYDKIREIQRGIVDFIRDYKGHINGTMILTELDPTLVSPIVANILLQREYMKKNVPLIRK